MTVYYTCTVDSRTDPKSGTVFFSFRFHASTHHRRYYCLFLAVNYKNTLPRSLSSFFVLRPRPPSSSIVLVQRPQVTNDHNIDIWFLRPKFFISILPSFLGKLFGAWQFACGRGNGERESRESRLSYRCLC